MAVNEAVEEAEGGSLGSMRRSMGGAEPGEATEGLRAVAERMARAGTTAGEPGTERLIGGKKPRAIVLALRARLEDAGVSLPTITKTYDPRVDVAS